MLGCVDSPTDFTEFTELLAEFVLPQISQICTELLAEIVLPQISQNSQKLGCLQGGASVPSVGVTLLLRRQGYLRYYLPHPTNLCKSVQSVGGSPQQQVL